MTTLPQMTVEARTSTTAHAIPEPDRSPETLSQQLEEAIAFNSEAKTEGWQISTLERLEKYLPINVDLQEIAYAVKGVLGFNDWGEISNFVQDDECTEFFNLCLKYCRHEGQAHRRNKGFIDGSGIGYMKAYLSRLKVTLEQCFDAKYFYQLERPLVFAQTVKDIDLSGVANKVHPGHWSYPAGHGTKFLTAVEVLNDVFALDKKCYRTLLITASVAAMARSGSLIHFPYDNIIGGKLTSLKEFMG